MFICLLGFLASFFSHVHFHFFNYFSFACNTHSTLFACFVFVVFFFLLPRKCKSSILSLVESACVCSLHVGTVLFPLSLIEY